MGARKSLLLGVVLIAAGAATTGCATKKYAREQAAVVDGRVTTVETRVVAVEGTPKDALDRATAAGKLAEGKFLYQMVLQDDAVKFDLDKADLSPEAESRLAAFVEKLKAENRNVYVEIQGHTDATGAPDYNEKLGESRAEVVRRYLNGHGVALNRLSTISYGEASPVAPNESPDGRAQNRRVVLVVMS